MIVVGGDLNGHIGTNVDGYDGVHGRYGFGERNADGERILEFCDAMELIVTNTCFKRQRKTNWPPIYLVVQGVQLITCCCEDVIDDIPV